MRQGLIAKRNDVCFLMTVAGIFIFLTCGLPVLRAESAAVVVISLENEFARWEVGSDGRNLHWLDKKTGTDYAQPGTPFASIKIGGQERPATKAVPDGDHVKLEFDQTPAVAILKAVAEKRFFTVEVVSLEGEQVECFTLVDIPLTLKGAANEPFAACALALNLQTNVIDIPSPSQRLRAFCYPRFGFRGAKVALLACPSETLRAVMKETIEAAPELPQTQLGGPWALDAPINRGSYLFNFGDMSEETVDEWINLAKELGINQIDFHGGVSFRFGDIVPNPKTYPRGLDSLRAVIDRLHAAGIAAGLHTYAFFIDKRAKWVTPIPDPRLAKDATFTLELPLDEKETTVRVLESTEKQSTVTDFFIRNSVTVQIDNELITYSGLSKTPPYAFTECQRGAWGTQPAAHAAGAKVHHLKECFGLFVPDGDSTLYAEVAACTAEAYNTCGFDMIYLDALDGQDIVGGWENGWHYGSKFVFEICKRLKKPAVFEMSTFHHHLWYVRSRMGAWDHPNRGHKRFVDMHCQANAALKRQFMPGHLGWWAFKTFENIQDEPTFSDDIEYLCGKCIGTDVGLSIMGVNPAKIKTNAAVKRLSGIMRQYETLRHKNYFDASIKAKLAEPGREFTLEQHSEAEWRLRPVEVIKHKVQGIDGWSNVWSINNAYAAQTPRIRIEALYSAGSYDAEANVVLADFAEPGRFADRATAKGVSGDLQFSTEQVKTGSGSGLFTAANEANVKPTAAWAKAGLAFDPLVNIKEKQALGLWVYGDGRGEVLNVQVRSPEEFTTRGIGDHYVNVDFTGWRYFNIIEMEGDRYADYQWPYGGPYASLRENVDYANLKTLSLWYNNLPADGKVACYLSPIKAMPLVKIKIKNPTLAIGGKKIAFPVEMETGGYLEYVSPTDCKLYNAAGELVGEIQPQGDPLQIQPGANPITFTCDGPIDHAVRARVTVICQGDPL